MIERRFNVEQPRRLRLDPLHLVIWLTIPGAWLAALIVIASAIIRKIHG